MPWTIALQLITQFGVPLAEEIWQKVQSGAEITADDWAKLKAAEAQSAKDRMTAQLAKAGIPLSDPKSVALLSLT